MPGYVIHIAVAKEYIRKHKDKVNDKEFIKGTIAPDFTKDKSTTHYGEKSSRPSLDKFIEKNDLETDYQKGYFIHLITDFLFYNKYLKRWDKEILHNDYDLTNKYLIEKYQIKLPEEVKDKVWFKEGEPKLINTEMLIDLIEEVSNLDIEKIKKEVLEQNEKWKLK